MPVAQAKGKNAAKIVSVNQLGIRSDKASPAPATIMSNGKIEIERKCTMHPRDIFTQPKFHAGPDHHMAGVKTELTLSNGCAKKRTIGGPDGSILKQY